MLFSSSNGFVFSSMLIVSSGGISSGSSWIVGSSIVSPSFILFSDSKSISISFVSLGGKYCSFNSSIIFFANFLFIPTFFASSL